jgi:hypothetical protein
MVSIIATGLSRALRLASLSLLLFLPLSAAALAQDEPTTPPRTDADLQADLVYRVVDREYLLRSLTQRDKLEYDPSGYAISGAEPGPLTLSGVHIRSVTVTPTSILLLGNRVALHYRGEIPDFQRIDLPTRPITITVHRDAPGDREDYTGTLARIFATSREPDFQQRLPEWWRGYFSDDYRRQVTGEYVNFGEDSKFHKMEADSIHLGHPKLIQGTTGFFLSPQDKIAIPGTVRLRLVVNEHGIPMHFFIDRPLGFGLEEEAVRQARKLRYSPATINGNPTDGEVYVNITFQRLEQSPEKKQKSMASRLR